MDANLRFSPAPGAASSRLVVNRDLIDRLFELHAEVRAAGGLEQEIDAQALMRWPGVVEEQAPDAEPLHAAALGRAGALDGRAARPLLELQRLADINRRLARSPVRGNLLLQDWLIQWARLGV